MGNKSENYSSQFFAGSFMHVWSFLQCLLNAKSPHDYLYRWKIPGENDDDDNYVFRQKLNLAKLSSTSNSNLRFLVNKSNFSWKLEKHFYISAFRCREFLLFFWIIKVHFSALIRAICLREIVLLFEALALNINFALVERE